MDKQKFMKMLGETESHNSSISEEFKATVRSQLEASKFKRHDYYDVSGEGTEYAICGVPHGVGFAQARVRLLPEEVEVLVDTGLEVDPENSKAARKLARAYSQKFKLRGLTLDESECLVFRTGPFDPVNGRFDAATAVGLALSTVHAYAGVALALNSGVPGWELLGYGEQQPDGDEDIDGDDDDGSPLEIPEQLSSLSELLDMICGEEDGEMPEVSAR